MPTYEYACKDCGHTFDAYQAFTDDALTECPECGGSLKKLFGNVGISFEGSGFYKTDSRSGSGASSGGSSSSDGDGSSGSDSSSDAGSKGETTSSDKKDTATKGSDGNGSGSKGGDAKGSGAKAKDSSSATKG